MRDQKEFERTPLLPLSLWDQAKLITAKGAHSKAEFQKLCVLVWQTIYLEQDLQTELDKVENLLECWQKYLEPNISPEERRSQDRFLRWCGCNPDSQEELQIISPEEFERAQEIRQSRTNSAEEERTVPLNTRGESLLSGNVFCAHCGFRLSLTTSGKYRKLRDGSTTPRIRYVCYGKTRKQTDCDGQTGYTMHILDGIVDKVVRQVFNRVRGISRQALVGEKFRKVQEERKLHLTELTAKQKKLRLIWIF